MKSDRYDVVAGVGLVLIGGGVWWIYPPAALIVVGIILLALGILMAATRK